MHGVDHLFIVRAIVNQNQDGKLDNDPAYSTSSSRRDLDDASELIVLRRLSPTDVNVDNAQMSSPQTSRGWDINAGTTPPLAGPSTFKAPYYRPRRSSSSIRRSRGESISSLPLYDPDSYTEDLIPQDVIFDGPSASSVPTSVSNFAHRSSRASFADEDRSQRFFAADFDEDAEEVLTVVDAEETERRMSLASSRISEVSSVAVVSTPDVERVGDQLPLITRHRSLDQRSEEEGGGRVGKATQKIYLADEDMVIVVSGFRTRRGRLWVYRLLCVLTMGMAYLVLRWLPRWRLTFMAESVPLSEAHWVVVEVCSLNMKLT